jgi:hypothetical protein
VRYLILLLLVGCGGVYADTGDHDAGDAGDGCSAYYEPIGDASILYDPCDPLPTKSGR